MTRYVYDAAELAMVVKHVQGLADYYGARPPSDGAMKRWVDQLQEEVPAYAALTVLAAWSKWQERMPTIAGVIRKAGELAERDAKRRSETEARDRRGPEDVRPENPEIEAAYRAFISALRSRPARPPRFWIYEGVLALADGVKLPELKRALCQKVLDRMSPAQVARLRQRVEAQYEAERVGGIADFLPPGPLADRMRKGHAGQQWIMYRRWLEEA